MTLRQLLLLPVLLLILSGTLLCAMTLSEADKALSGGNKSEIFRAYDTYKSRYLTASVGSDKALQKRCLEGIVKSGKKLHIDVGSYEKKLAQYASLPARTAEAAPKKSSAAKKNAPKVTAQNRLQSIEWRSGKLLLTFDQTLGKRDVNYFALKKSGKKGYRYVFDIHAVLDSAHTLKHRDIKRISLSQYKSATLRLVFENSTRLPVRFSRKGKTLTIDAGVSKVTSPKAKPAYTKQHYKRNKVVVIDPGHGGKDGGAVGYRKYREKDIVLSIAKKTAALLRARGYTVFMTRANDRFIKLRNRTHYANKKNADLFISIHANAVPKHKVKSVHGIETYFLSPSRSKRANDAAALENSAEIEDMNFYGKSSFLNALNSEKIVASHKLAIDLQSSLLSSLRARYKEVKDGGVREGPFWVLVGAQMPAVLVEVGFITHPMEAKRLNSKRYQETFAAGLADGVERYFAKNR